MIQFFFSLLGFPLNVLWEWKNPISIKKISQEELKKFTIFQLVAVTDRTTISFVSLDEIIRDKAAMNFMLFFVKWERERKEFWQISHTEKKCLAC